MSLSRRFSAWGVCLLIMAAALIAYWPAFSAEFVSWDDYKMVRDNAALNPPTWHMAVQRFEGPYFQLYTPVTNLLLQGLALLGTASKQAHDARANPAVFHTGLVVLHLAAIPLAFLFFRSLVHDEIAAVLGAGVIALHPLAVEATAWVSGIGLAVSVPLIAILLWQWIKFRRTPSARSAGWHYAAATACYILALLIKPSNVTIPLMAWAIDAFIAKENWRRSLLAIGPWFILTAPIVLATHIAQSSAAFTFWQPAYWQRPLVAGDALAFYLRKIIWPAALTVDYGRTPAFLFQHPAVIICESLAVLGMGIILWQARKRFPIIAFGAAIFVFALLPVLGLASFAFQIYSTVADRYAYPALLGVGLIVAAVLASLRMPLLKIGASAVLVIWAVLTFAQARVWRDNYSLFTHAAECNPRSWVAFNSLGNALILDGRPAEGLAMARRAWEIAPERPRTAINIGTALALLHRPAEALPYLHFAATHEPDDALVALNLSKVFTQLHDPSQAARWRNEARRRSSANLGK